MMELSNFRLIDEHGNIEIEVMGEVWNLHDAYYLGLGHSFLYDERGFVTSNQVQLSWQVDPARYSAAGFSLRFHDVSFFEVTPRDNEMPIGEDTCLDSVAKVSIEDETSEIKRLNYINTENSDTKAAHLYFRFHGGQTVRIYSREAEFIKSV